MFMMPMPPPEERLLQRGPVALIASFDATTLFFRLDLDRAVDADEFNQLRETDEPP
jgi:hypothetical protein